MTVSIVLDLLGSFLPRGRGQKVPPPERHYYTSKNIFEQSLDIYRPAASVANARKAVPASGASSAASTPIVALVVGSAWLGHRSFIYSGTSWWNSSGPKGISELGYVCVCIRHRGSFMKTFSMLTLLFVLVVAALVTALLDAVLDQRAWDLLEGLAGERMVVGRAGGFLLAVVTGLLMIELGGIGCATYDGMQSDVMDALVWLAKNEETLQLARPNERLFVFGGYGSGGHVVAAVSQDPRLWKERGLDPPHVHCDALLYISPVLATKSCDGILRSKEPASSAAATEPPSLSLTSSSPTWLTDQIVQAVFGRAAPTVPSPLHTYDKSPAVPHVFLGCRQEMFGLPWLDTFFAAPACCELLNACGVESRYTAVRSDHWSVLASDMLSFSLRQELEWIELKCRKSKE